MSTFTLPFTFEWYPYAGHRTDWEIVTTPFFKGEVYTEAPGHETWTWVVLVDGMDYTDHESYPTRDAAKKVAEAKLAELFTGKVL